MSDSIHVNTILESFKLVCFQINNENEETLKPETGKKLLIQKLDAEFLMCTSSTVVLTEEGKQKHQASTTGNELIHGQNNRSK